MENYKILMVLDMMENGCKMKCMVKVNYFYQMVEYYIKVNFRMENIMVLDI